MGSLSPSQLLAARAELLQRSDDPHRLAELTRQLRIELAAAEPTVRRLEPGHDGALLAELARREPVNPVRDDADLADRVDADRRCLVLEHPALPDQVLAVVWCALWHGAAGDLGAILDPDAPCGDPAAADVAVFYSIWNVAAGAAGLDAGRQLLERAVPTLRTELPQLHEFLTLSPMPGFRAWCEREDHRSAPDLEQADTLRRLGARYLSALDDRGRPIDPVARFHLGNGARLLAVHAGADLSERGLERSFGLMANYRYEPEDRDANRAALDAGRPAMSRAVIELLEPR